MGIVHASNNYIIVPFLRIYVQGLFTMTKASGLYYYHLCMYHTLSHLHKHNCMQIPYTDQYTMFKYQEKLHSYQEFYTMHNMMFTMQHYMLTMQYHATD